MPFAGLGLHFIIALFFAVHAIRAGRELYWLIILFSFPLLGSLVYFFVVYLPHSKLDRGIRKVTKAAVKSLDPGRELRDAQQAFELTPTAQNQQRLANAFLEAGDSAQAVQHFDQCLRGPFARDGAIRLGAARAHLRHADPAAAITLLESIRKESPTFQPEDVSLLLAQALGEEGRVDDARREFTDAVARFGSVDARAEFAIWAAGMGDAETATAQRAELEKTRKHWQSHTRDLHQALFRRVDSAISAGRKAG
ncbi:MAG: tetratricopeptide repeat protein [Betaproteobacteria bacterium]